MAMRTAKKKYAIAVAICTEPVLACNCFLCGIKSLHEFPMTFLGLLKFLLNKYSWKCKSHHKTPCKSPSFRSGKIESRTRRVASAVDYLNHYTRTKCEASIYILIINTMTFFFFSPPLLPFRIAQATVVQRVDSGFYRKRLFWSLKY